MGLFKSSTAVGLELDTGVIRVVQLKGTPQNAVLAAVEQIEIPEEAVVEGVVADGSAVAGALEKLWVKAGIRKRDVVLGISNQGVLMRMAALPSIPEEKLAQAMRFQAEEYFPIPISEMVLDFSVVGRWDGENGPEMEVLLVAARRDILDKSINALKLGGLNPEIIDASPLALMRVLPEEKLTGTVVLVDIANGLSTLLLVDNGVPRFSRVLSRSVQSYAEKNNVRLAEFFTLPGAAAAAEGKEDIGSGGIPAEWGIALAGEIRVSISYYLTQTKSGSVDYIYLSGSGTRVKGLPGLLQRELDVPVEVIQPSAKLKKITGVPGTDIEKEGPDFAVSVGLALRGLGEP
ncbi:type IV pilus assembly protein PilM [Desulfohalotomaculum tongense]|uniref:type IV pilus biogenesis protein PilM n=1 Tax=Desulforadius tongensis TaxID=1216062 RepID=UPI0019595696|nr:type IV pilus assembly protein PilM [Desulforadius tongensis]MBM7854063.1 type IV pilus assembly protein PilM [Desulforadius tongensis]